MHKVKKSHFFSGDDGAAKAEATSNDRTKALRMTIFPIQLKNNEWKISVDQAAFILLTFLFDNWLSPITSSSAI